MESTAKQIRIDRRTSGACDNLVAFSLLLHPAILRLWEACRLVQDVSPDDVSHHLNDFAVPIRELRECGMSDWQMRWLTMKGYAVHRGTLASLPAHADAQVGEVTKAPPIGADGSLAVTSVGLDLFRRIAQAITELSGQTESFPALGGNGSYNKIMKVPFWDCDLRELRVGEDVVKQLKGRAANQELLLSAFEEEGWPTRIDDPLPPQPGIDARLRLRDTITSLNRHQQASRVRFHGDGTGRGVRWELVD